MSITEENIAFLIATARKASVEAILPRFRWLATLEVACKTSHDDLVTIADRQSEEIIGEAVKAYWPEAAILGEEAVSEGKVSREIIATADRCVVIDPIDGTWNFASGLGVFGVIIAVVEHGQTVAGVLYDPLGDDAVFAMRGRGAWFCDRHGRKRRLSTNGVKAIERMTGVVGVDFARTLLPHSTRHGSDFGRIFSIKCSCHEYRMLAMAAIDFIAHRLLEPWDHAAGVLVVQEAGGFVRHLDGEPYRPTRHQGAVLIASCQSVYKAVQHFFADA